MATIIANLEALSGRVDGAHWGEYGKLSKELPVLVKIIWWDSNSKLEETFGLGELSNYEFPHSRGAVRNFSSWQDWAHLPNLWLTNRAKEAVAIDIEKMWASRGWMEQDFLIRLAIVPRKVR